MKGLVKIFAGLVVVLILAVAGGVYYLDSIAKKAIVYGGEEALGVPTSLNKINISLFDGTAALDNLTVANPKGFTEATFMALGKGDVALSLGSLQEDTVVIPRIQLSAIRVNFEQQGKKNNVQPLLARAKGAGGGASSSAARPADSSEAKKFVVEYFALEDVQVNAILDVLGQASKVNLVLPKIELRNLGREQGGLTMPELVQKVVQVVLDAAANSSADLSPMLAKLLKGELKGLDKIQSAVIGQASAKVEKAVSEVTKKLEQVPIPAGGGEQVQKEKEKLLKGMQGILGGKK